MSKKTLTPEDRAFYQGVICALAVVRSHDNETLYHEIVGSVGRKELLAAAVDEDRAWCGLVKYGYCRRPKGFSKEECHQ